jgi:hypothetical protein
MIHDIVIVNTEREVRKTNMEIKMPYAVDLCSKFMKGINRADQNISYYSFQRKTVKWEIKKTQYCIC